MGESLKVICHVTIGELEYRGQIDFKAQETGYREVGDGVDGWGWGPLTLTI